MSQSALGKKKKKHKIWTYADFNLREEIEKHNEKFMRRKEKATTTNEMSEITKRGIQITRDLNLSPRSCCPKLFNAISDEIPEVKHNQPLSHMIRPVQQMIRDFYEGRSQKVEPTRKKWGVGGKQAESELAAYY